MRILAFLAILLTALALVPGGAHVLAMAAAALPCCLRRHRRGGAPRRTAGGVPRPGDLILAPPLRPATAAP